MSLANPLRILKHRPAGCGYIAPGAEKGLRCLAVELREREIDALVAKKLLPSTSRGDVAAIRKALYAYLDGTLGRSL